MMNESPVTHDFNFRINHARVCSASWRIMARFIYLDFNFFRNLPAFGGTGYEFTSFGSIVIICLVKGGVACPAANRNLLFPDNRLFAFISLNNHARVLRHAQHQLRHAQHQLRHAQYQLRHAQQNCDDPASGTGRFHNITFLSNNTHRASQ